MSEKKLISILSVPSDFHGVSHFRNIWCAQEMELNHKKEFYVEINHQPNLDDIEYLKKFDIIHFHRGLGPKEQEDIIFERIKTLGIKLVMDIDDFWQVPRAHPMYEIIMKEKFPEKILGTLKKMDYITTTTELFKEEIKKVNREAKIYVIPNAVNLNDPAWGTVEDKRLPDDERCRIMWLGGSSHNNDLKLMEHSFELLYKSEELKDKFQVHMCGYDIRGSVSEISVDEFGKQTINQRPLKPHESVWNKFEAIFTSNYNGLSDDPEYVKWLKQCKKGDYPDLLTKRYVRHWTRPLTTYQKMYDYSDVCLSPLEEIDRITKPNGQIVNQPNIFNKVKSELKIIEAGMKKKALIAQDFGIYQQLLKHEDTALLVNKNDKGWYQAMRRLVLDKDLREKLANNLHEFVKDRYSIVTVTKDRVEIYKQILNDQIIEDKKEEFILQPIVK